MKFLIDECLSVELVAVAGAAGHEAQHVARIGKAGWKDWNVARYAAAGDFVLVTNNASDFRRLYARTSLHAGLIIILPNAGRAMQRVIFRAVLEEAQDAGDLINRVLEVGLEGDAVTFALYDLPPPG